MSINLEKLSKSNRMVKLFIQDLTDSDELILEMYIGEEINFGYFIVETNKKKSYRRGVWEGGVKFCHPNFFKYCR